MVCGSLIELSNSSRLPNDPVSELYYRFIHRATIDFFKSSSDLSIDHHPYQVQSMDQAQSKASRMFSFPPYESETELTRLCLFYLTYRSPAQPLSGNILEKASRSTVRGKFPFLRYAALYWSSHLVDTVCRPSRSRGIAQPQVQRSFDSMVTSIAQFLSQTFVLMAWVEALYMFQSIVGSGHSLIHTNMQKWSAGFEALDMLQINNSFPHLSSSVLAFAKDLAVMHHLWAETLTHSQEQIWKDITTFTPSRFFAETTASNVDYMPQSINGQPDLGHIPLCTISAESPGGSELGVLTIWPSR